ncbi:MAG: hypothetical protein M3Q50_01110 [Chloroflexota bacterium]|nr:hypothetical protein [Chloroflexia bacterium]MDQ3225216.1 hypothetical protein [Chloroflexota bacterium]
MTQAQKPAIGEGVAASLRTRSGANKSAAVIAASRTGLAQLVAFLRETICAIGAAASSTPADAEECLAHLADQGSIRGCGWCEVNPHPNPSPSALGEGLLTPLGETISLRPAHGEKGWR